MDNYCSLTAGANGVQTASWNKRARAHTPHFLQTPNNLHINTHWDKK